MPDMNIRISFLALGLSLLFLFAPAPASAFSLFGGGKSSRLEKAENLYQQGVLAEAENRALDAVDFLQSALSEFSKLHSDAPEFESERVKDGFVASHNLLSSIMARLRSGELSVPSPDEVVSGAGNGYVSQESEPQVDVDAPAPIDAADAFEDKVLSDPAPVVEEAPAPAPVVEETPAPAPVVEEAPAPAPVVEEAPAPAPVVEEVPAPAPVVEEAPVLAPKPTAKAGKSKNESVAASLTGPIPNPLYAGEPEPAPAVHQPSARLASIREVGASGKLPEDERLQALVLVNMIRKAQAPDVVMMLEDDFEKPDVEVPLTTRLVFARALLECRNYVRASEVLKAVPAADEGNPSVRTLRAALAVAQGQYEEAFYELDRLIADHPSYSDAYIDFAYVNFLMDPVGNRETSILYYKSGLEYGAKRDPRLEAELRIKIGK